MDQRGEGSSAATSNSQSTHSRVFYAVVFGQDDFHEATDGLVGLGQRGDDVCQAAHLRHSDVATSPGRPPATQLPSSGSEKGDLRRDL